MLDGPGSVPPRAKVEEKLPQALERVRTDTAADLSRRAVGFGRAQLLAKGVRTGRVQWGRKVPERGPLPHSSTHVGRHFFGLCN